MLQRFIKWRFGCTHIRKRSSKDLRQVLNCDWTRNTLQLSYRQGKLFQRPFCLSWAEHERSSVENEKNQLSLYELHLSSDERLLNWLCFLRSRRSMKAPSPLRSSVSDSTETHPGPWWEMAAFTLVTSHSLEQAGYRRTDPAKGPGPWELLE